MSDLSWHRGRFSWRWLSELLWSLERTFKRALVTDKAEGETRLRIFFLLALFFTGFIFLAIGATRCALFIDTSKGGAYVAPTGAARADVVDRNGNLLAIDLTHYGSTSIREKSGIRPRPNVCCPQRCRAYSPNGSNTPCVRIVANT